VQPTDQILLTAQDRFTKAFGAGVIPWQQILAAIMSILTGCLNPTPAAVRAAFDRPIIRLKMIRRLLQAGVLGKDVVGVLNAVQTIALESTDDEMATFIQASQESE